jgi:hypothetical protein
MKTFNENDSVIYTDPDGRQIDTFVIFGTDMETGLTHINYNNLEVSNKHLRPHPCKIPGHNLPLNDAFSFEIIRKLKEKQKITEKANNLRLYLLANAS